MNKSTARHEAKLQEGTGKIKGHRKVQNLFNNFFSIIYLQIAKSKRSTLSQRRDKQLQTKIVNTQYCKCIRKGHQ